MDQRHVSDIVRRAPVTLPDSATVRQACAEMRRQRIGAVMVLDAAGALAGIFTGRDAVRLLAEGRAGERTMLRRAMTPAPAHMRPGHTALDALRLMQDGGFRHVPICDNGRVVGIVSRGDFRPEEQARLDEETGFWERI